MLLHDRQLVVQGRNLLNSDNAFLADDDPMAFSNDLAMDSSRVGGDGPT